MEGSTEKNAKPWFDCAGLSLVPTATNTLLNMGQIPHNFPVMDKSPKLVIEPWLPRFVHDIIADAKKQAIEMVRQMHSSGESTPSLSSVASAKSKSSKRS